MAKAKPEAPAHIVEAYEKLIATNPKVQCKGAATRYTSHNGNMFTFLDKQGGVSIRLDVKEREAFLKKYNAKLSVQYGTIMKEYVLVPPALVKKTAELKNVYDASYRYVCSLKAKPTTKPKKKTAKASAKKTAKKKSAKKKSAKKKSAKKKTAKKKTAKAAKKKTAKKKTAKKKTARAAKKKTAKKKTATKKKTAKKKKKSTSRAR